MKLKNILAEPYIFAVTTIDRKPGILFLRRCRPDEDDKGYAEMWERAFDTEADQVDFYDWLTDRRENWAIWGAIVSMEGTAVLDRLLDGLRREQRPVLADQQRVPTGIAARRLDDGRGPGMALSVTYDGPAGAVEHDVRWTRTYPTPVRRDVQLAWAWDPRHVAVLPLLLTLADTHGRGAVDLLIDLLVDGRAADGGETGRWT